MISAFWLSTATIFCIFILPVKEVTCSITGVRKDDSEWVKKCMDFVVEGVIEVFIWC